MALVLKALPNWSRTESDWPKRGRLDMPRKRRDPWLGLCIGRSKKKIDRCRREWGRKSSSTPSRLDPRSCYFRWTASLIRLCRCWRQMIISELLRTKGQQYLNLSGGAVLRLSSRAVLCRRRGSLSLVHCCSLVAVPRLVHVVAVVHTYIRRTHFSTYVEVSYDLDL